MIRFYIGTALLLVCLTTTAQTTPTGSLPVPPPVPPASAADATLMKTPSGQASANNPFAPRSESTASQAAAAPSNLAPPPPPPPTEQSVRAQVESAFRTSGARVGRVNGQTFFKLDKDYLFVPTGLEDAQPVVSTKAPVAAAATPADGARVAGPTPPVTTRPQSSSPGR